MTQMPTSEQPQRWRRSLWVALALVLLLVGWWALSALREPGAPLSCQSQLRSLRAPCLNF